MLVVQQVRHAVQIIVRIIGQVFAELSMQVEKHLVIQMELGTFLMKGLIQLIDEMKEKFDHDHAIRLDRGSCRWVRDSWLNGMIDVL